MPRGVYTRKKSAAKKSAAKKSAAKKSAAKIKADFLAAKKSRRARGRVVETEEIPTISRSLLKSSVSAERSPPAAHALVSQVTPAAPQLDGVLEDRPSFCLVNDDGEMVDSCYDTFEEALAKAKQEVAECVEANEQDYTIDIFQRVARVDGEVPEEVKAKITVKAVAGSPV